MFELLAIPNGASESITAYHHRYVVFMAVIRQRGQSVMLSASAKRRGT